MVNDSIADMLTRIRNAQTARHESVTLETSINKTPRGEHRQNTLRHTSQQDPL